MHDLDLLIISQQIECFMSYHSGRKVESDCLVSKG